LASIYIEIIHACPLCDGALAAHEWSRQGLARLSLLHKIS